MIKYVDLLGLEEKDLILNLLYDLRGEWIPRHKEFFYTLGGASWLDIKFFGDSNRYNSFINKYNPVLRTNFGWLHNKIVDTLSQVLGEPVFIKEGVGLPGFHIFLAHPDLTRSEKDMLMQEWYLNKLIRPDLISSPIHYDDFEKVALGKADSTLSFTLAIQLPSSASGLNLWNISRSDTLNLSNNKERQAVLSSLKKFYAYSVGSLFIHDGSLYHQAVIMSSYKEGEARITMQGHAIRQNGVWNVYW